MILPASPSFYSHPQSIEELVETIVERIIAHLGIKQRHYEWGK
jgi:4-hydroxy-3-polyprenylbenzoate decarboxylase